MPQTFAALRLAAAVSLAAAGLPAGTAAAQDGETSRTAGAMGARAVLVKLQSWTLGFDSAEVAAGEVTFRIENVGTAPHGFAIRGEGVDRVLADIVLPKGVRTEAISLEAGSYTLYCPIEGHAENGMTATLSVAGP